jgi:FKBP-type peptidyl-prolyl cis-trans isomerase (trigger factor)
MKTEANGSLISELRQQVVKDASKHANFPGFRKGQVPPYAQSKMTTFAIQEGIIKSCEMAVKAYGLKALSGNDGSVEVHEDMQEVSKIYKLGDDLPFTATFQAVFDPEKQSKVQLGDEKNSAE